MDSSANRNVRLAHLVASALLLIATTLGGTKAIAQPTPLEQAREYHFEGMEALRSGEPVRAEAAFRSALDIEFRPSTAYNLALLLTDLHRGQEANALYERVLGAGDDELPRARHEIEDDQGRARAMCGVILLEVSAVPANVRVDGLEWNTLVETDQASLWLQPGPHEIEVQHGTMREHRVVQVAQGESETIGMLALAPGAAAATLPAPDSPERRRRRRLGVGIAAGILVATAVVLALVLRPSQNSYAGDAVGEFSALRSDSLVRVR